MAHVKNIAVLTSGGDAPGMNACIRAVVRTAVTCGVGVFGVRRGYAGLVSGYLEEMDRHAVGNVIQRGGTILGTARSEEFRTPEGRAKAADVMRAHAIDGLVAIGGEGTYKGAEAFIAEHPDISCVGLPGTIDNDIGGTDRSIGFDTAVNTVLEAIDRIRETAAAHEMMHFIEVMGRTCGWIALLSGVAGGAEAILVPEVRTDHDEVTELLERHIEAGRGGIIVVVAEGEPGGARGVADDVAKRIDRDYRITVLGHLQRGGAPTAIDRVLASRLGAAAVDALREGTSGVALGEVAGKVVFTPLPEAAAHAVDLDESLLRLITLLH